MSKILLSSNIKSASFQADKDIPYVNVSDAEALAYTMLDAYINTVDYEGETYEDSLLELKNVFDGGYGDFLEQASFLLKKDGKIASAILVSLYKDVPYILYVFTAKEHWGRGLATQLIKHSIKKLQEMGYEEVQLSVTAENHNARYLYEKLGFRERNNTN